MESKELIAAISESEIKEKIYTIRGMQVMLDSDLAKLYQVETKNLNKAMKRNIERFPERYCFRLTQNEYDDLKFQFGTSNEMGGRRYLPYVFTEQGVAMLSGVLHSKIAVEISIRVIDTFVEMRRYLADNALLFQNIGKVNQKLMEHEEKIDVLFKQLEEPRKKKAALFFKGQLFDAFSCLADIISKAKETIVLIDNYVDTGTLDLLSKKKPGVSVNLVTSQKGCKLTTKEISDFNGKKEIKIEDKKDVLEKAFKNNVDEEFYNWCLIFQYIILKMFDSALLLYLMVLIKF